jgi:hypothetical protein
MSRNGQREQGHVRDLLVTLSVIATDEELKPQLQAIWVDDVGKGLEMARIDAAQDLSRRKSAQHPVALIGRRGLHGPVGFDVREKTRVEAPILERAGVFKESFWQLIPRKRVIAACAEGAQGPEAAKWVHGDKSVPKPDHILEGPFRRLAELVQVQMLVEPSHDVIADRFGRQLQAATESAEAPEDGTLGGMMCHQRHGLPVIGQWNLLGRDVDR